MKDLKDHIAGIAAALSVVGVVIFGAQRIAYERFYDQFGLSPEDVGVDFSRVLHQTAGGLAAISLLVALLAGGFWLFAAIVGRASGRNIGRTLAWVLPVLAGFFTLEQLLLNTTHADDAAKCAARLDGKPVRGFRTHLPGGVLVTRLNIRADRAFLESTNPKDPMADTWEGRPLVYLGTANSTVFVYDPAENVKRTYRVPAASVTVSTDTTMSRYTTATGC